VHRAPGAGESVDNQRPYVARERQPDAARFRTLSVSLLPLTQMWGPLGREKGRMPPGCAGPVFHDSIESSPLGPECVVRLSIGGGHRCRRSMFCLTEQENQQHNFFTEHVSKCPPTSS
jgi:hypothetical protein